MAATKDMHIDLTGLPISDNFTQLLPFLCFCFFSYLLWRWSFCAFRHGTVEHSCPGADMMLEYSEVFLIFGRLGAKTHTNQCQDSEYFKNRRVLVLEQMGGKGEGGVGTTPAGQPAKSTIRVRVIDGGSNLQHDTPCCRQGRMPCGNVPPDIINPFAHTRSYNILLVSRS